MGKGGEAKEVTNPASSNPGSAAGTVSLSIITVADSGLLST